MAQIEKYNLGQAMAIIAHCERTGAMHSNRNIDMARTKENYALWPPAAPDKLIMGSEITGQSTGKYAYQRLRKRLREVSYLQRDDVNVLCDWCLHLGADVPPGYESKMDFFRAAVAAMATIYGKENVVYAWVHEDETHSHLHFGFVPVVKKPLKLRKNASEATKKAYEEAVAAGKTEIERIDANALINRKHLQGWHGRMTKYLKGLLGYDPGIFTGITQALGGNQTVKQLKRTGSDWREQRNQKVEAFHNARRAQAAGEVPALNDRITAAHPLSLVGKLADANERKGKKRR